MKARLVPALLVLALVACVAAFGVVAISQDDADEATAGGTALAAATTDIGGRNLPPKSVGRIREPEPGYLAAQAAVPSVDLYAHPDSPTPMWDLPNPTHEGVPLAFTVLEQEGSRLHVRLPMRPNGSTAWIESDQVTSYVVPNHLLVDLSDRTVTAKHGDETLMTASLAVGAPATPTPTGDFYIDISVPNPGGSYGEWMLSVAGFSNVLQTFGGGIGQIAFHGWSDESVIGQAVSNGCLRMPNSVITRLAPLAPVGTPVTIQA